MFFEEEWRPVVGYEGSYEVSSFGRIVSLPRRVPRGETDYYHPVSVLRPKSKNHRYPMVSLSKNNKPWDVHVHRVVAEAYIGPSGGGMDVNHLDNDGWNNSIWNLEVITHRENMLHAWRIGCWDNVVYRRGSECYQSKLTEDDIPVIRGRLSGGESCEVVAADYPVTRQAINEIRKGGTWTHVD